MIYRSRRRTTRTGVLDGAFLCEVAFLSNVSRARMRILYERFSDRKVRLGIQVGNSVEDMLGVVGDC